MKLRFLVTPPKHALASELAGFAQRLEAAGVAGLDGAAAGAPLSAGLVDGTAADAAAAAQQLAAAAATLDRAGAGLRCELVDEPVAPLAAGAGARAPAVTPAAAFHDLDGARVHEALPKVLAHVARATGAGRPEAATLGGGIELLRGEAGRIIALAPVQPARFVELEPERGAQLAVAERLRALACAGAAPLAVHAGVRVPETLSLADVTQLAAVLRGVAEACARFELNLIGRPLVRGARPGLQVAVFGAMADEKQSTPAVVQRPGENLVLLGEAPHELGGSHFVEAVHGLHTGPVPELDLAVEKRLNKTLLALIKAGVLGAARPVAAGGLLSNAAAMLLGPQGLFGARLEVTPLGGARADALLFGESQGRVLVAVEAGRVGTVLTEAQIRGVPAALVGEITAAPTLSLKTRSLATEWPVAALQAAVAAAG